MRSLFDRLGRDLAYVLPGVFISTLGFVVLLTLFVVGVSTLIIWVGALIIPFALVVAGGFADLSRRRLLHWSGGELGGEADVRVEDISGGYRPTRPGVLGRVRTMADPRRWLDLVFECLLAFPLRLTTFVVAVSWMATALGGITYVVWGAFLPAGSDSGVGFLIDRISGGAVPETVSSSFAVHATVHFVVGVIFALTLPFLMRGLALVDAAAVRAALVHHEDAGREGDGRGRAAGASGIPADEPGYSAGASGVPADEPGYSAGASGVLAHDPGAEAGTGPKVPASSAPDAPTGQRP